MFPVVPASVVLRLACWTTPAAHRIPRRTFIMVHHPKVQKNPKRARLCFAAPSLLIPRHLYGIIGPQYSPKPANLAWDQW
jgi:hypothetical protein